MWPVPEDGSAEEGAFSERLCVWGGKPKPCSYREFIAVKFGESGDSVFLSSSIGPRARDSNW